MTPQAKSTLSKTIRALRTRLIDDLAQATRRRYRLHVSSRDSGLNERRLAERARLESWLQEQKRAHENASSGKKKSNKEERDEASFLHDVIKEAAYTLLNRVVLLRLMEEADLVGPPVIDGGWDSKGYREFTEWAPGLLDDETQGYQTLLNLVFDELAHDLPGLYGKVGLTQLIPVPPATLRELVEQLNQTELDTCWSDDTTFGWVYQYWNDPEREELDAKLNSRGKIEPHEVASKTQLFTERYMVEWLLQNSLGQIWLAMCDRHGWTPDVVQHGTLDQLEQRRQDWRQKREAGEVALDDLMPIHSDLEDRWKYYVPTTTDHDAENEGTPPRTRGGEREVLGGGPQAGETTTKALGGGPQAGETTATDLTTLRDLKLLDPACGSGHFLIIAFDLLFALYQEEARHLGETWTDAQITTWIIEDNLHGIDIDRRAVQIAAAALYFKGRARDPDFRPTTLNLVAPDLSLGNLPADDPALVELRQAIERDIGIPTDLVDTILNNLQEAYHLGSLLRLDEEIDAALEQFEAREQGDLLKGPATQLDETSEARVALLEQLEAFLAEHSSSDDLGLRLHGEQLANGIRFVRINQEERYDLVMANPPYLGSSNMRNRKYIRNHYPAGKADLYAAFLERGLQLTKEGGLSAMVTMRGWMFIKTYEDLRKHLVQNYDLRALGDLGSGAFEEISGHVVSATLSIVRCAEAGPEKSAAVNLTEEDSSKSNRTTIKRSALLAQVGRDEFSIQSLECIEGQPLVYWWDEEFLERYLSAPKLGESSDVREGIGTRDNYRFIRDIWEVPSRNTMIHPYPYEQGWDGSQWVPVVKGSAGEEWIEPLRFVLNWQSVGLEIATYEMSRFGRGASHYFRQGIALTVIGSDFGGRLHRYCSIISDAGVSVFRRGLADTLCLVNSALSRRMLESFNPTVNFKIYDANRLAIFPIKSADEIVAQLDQAFTEHEAARETSVEFKKPGPSCWEYAQDWAQKAVDRPEGEPLPDWQPEYDEAPPENWLSWAVGVTLGRFDEAGEVGWLNVDPLRLANNARHLPDSGRSTKGFGESLLADEEGLGREAGSIERSDSAADGEGGRPRNPSTPQPLNLPDGILFVTATDGDDSLAHRATGVLHEMWDKYGDDVGRNKDDLNSWLREKFFKSVHRQMYDNAPIYFPLSSEQKTFVAHVNIHRWDEHTLTKLLANHLVPERNRLEGLLSDLNRGRASDDDDTRRRAEDQYADVKAWLEELEQFIADVEQCAEKGAPSTGKGCPEREVDARFVPDLDDGTMINSAALWPLFYPQWKKPKKQWKKLANEKGFRGKHFDWSTLAARYWPTRVDQKCQEDPSLAVAHKCFWKYHPERAYEWELRLQDEIHPNFTIDEEGSDAARKAFFADQADKVEGIRADEYNRRERNADGEADIWPVAAPQEHPTSEDVVPEPQDDGAATRSAQTESVPAE